MGIYINPQNGSSKESWLQTNGTRLASAPSTGYNFKSGKMPVCLMDNGMFTAAAAVAYSDGEISEFSRADGRPKSWYEVDVDLLNASIVGEAYAKRLQEIAS